jgi:hypothetical protein
MKEELRKHWIVYGVVYVFIVVIMLVYFWKNIPIYPQPWVQVENEEELIETLKEDMPRVAYPHFLKSEYGCENATYQKRIPGRARFSQVEGYGILECEIVMENKSFIIDISVIKAEGKADNDNFQYRGVDGFVGTMNSERSSGVVGFMIDEFSYRIQYRPQEMMEITEEETSKVNKEALKIAHRLIDMALDGDTIGK